MAADPQPIVPESPEWGWSERVLARLCHPVAASGQIRHARAGSRHHGSVALQAPAALARFPENNTGSGREIL